MAWYGSCFAAIARMTPDRIDTTWILVATCMIFIMQAGFCCLESGFVRAKNSINVALKNLADFCIAGLLFWAFGFALAFGPFRITPYPKISPSA